MQELYSYKKTTLFLILLQHLTHLCVFQQTTQCANHKFKKEARSEFETKASQHAIIT